MLLLKWYCNDNRATKFLLEKLGSNAFSSCLLEKLLPTRWRALHCSKDEVVAEMLF